MGRALLLRLPVVLVVVLLAAAAAAYHYDLGPRWLGTTDGSAPPPVAEGLGLDPPAAEQVRPVAAAAPGTVPGADRVRRALAPLLGDDDLARLHAVVAPLAGDPLLVHGHGAAMPASTMKLLTTTAALQVLGPQRRFTTTVVRNGRHSVTLVGGGDPFLASATPTDVTGPSPASLQELARTTAHMLRGLGVHRVSVGYDASLFTGPAVSPHWPATYVSEQVVTPISALWADEGVVDDHRVADPASTAAADFASYLGKDGVRVTGTPRARTARDGATVLARADSEPLGDIVEQVLQTSDNEGAEVLARQVGIAVSGTGSFTAGVAGVRRTLAGLGVDLRGLTAYDGSGLSRQDRLRPQTLVQVLQLTASADHPTLRPVVTGLPVAAFDGSLADRFDGEAGAGWVRAKTGTLTGTSGLAGIAADARGRVLVFAFLSDHIPVVGTLDARAALDGLASALARCRC